MSHKNNNADDNDNNESESSVSVRTGIQNRTKCLWGSKGMTQKGHWVRNIIPNNSNGHLTSVLAALCMVMCYISTGNSAAGNSLNVLYNIGNNIFSIYI